MLSLTLIIITILSFRDGSIPLCGRCLDGYSESLFSTKCKPDSECSGEVWAWVMMAVYGLAYVTFFLFDKEWATLMKKLRRFIFQYFQNKKVEEDKRPGAILTIFMYFVQVGALLQVDIHYMNDRNQDFKDTSKSASNIFSFDTLGLTGWNTCIMKGIDPVKKLLLKAAFIFYLFATLLVLYLVSVFIRCPWAMGRWNQHGCGLVRLSFQARFLNAFVILILLTYEFLSENGLLLLNCVHINSLNNGNGADVLFIDGSVTCYQDWQYGVILFVCVYVVPMFVVIGVAPILLKKDRINLVIFIISMIFPLFALPYLVYLFIKLHQNKKRFGRRRRRDDFDRSRPSGYDLGSCC